MTDTTGQLTQTTHRDQVVSAGSVPTWWIVFTNEMHSLWIGGKVPILLVLFSIVLGFQSFVTAYNVELSLMPPKEMVYETLKTAISVGLFIGMIIGADAISGERERATLESLLLTPSGRQQIVVGKLLAALSPWPAALLLSIPYMAVLAQEDEVLLPAIVLGAILGTILTLAYTCIGMLVSFWSNSNRTSYLVSLAIFVLVLVPAQLPGRAQTGAAGQFLQQLNPLAAQNHFLSKVLVNNRTVEEYAGWLWSPVVFALVAFVLLIFVSAPGLRLEAGRASLFRWNRNGKSKMMAGLFLAGILMALLTRSAPVLGQESAQMTSDAPLEITVDLEYQVGKTGDAIFFDTVVTNLLEEPSPPTIVAMNIINLDKEGDVVDPEDWSPERTQYIERLNPGDSATLSWRVNAILDGDYIIYMVAMPEPSGREATSQAVASSGIHLTVMPFTRLNPGGIMPMVLGTPVVLAIGTAVLFVTRRRETETGDTTEKPSKVGYVGAGVVLALIVLAVIATSSQSGQPVPVVLAESTPAAETTETAAASEVTAITLQVDTASGAEDFSYVQQTLEAPAGSTITLDFNNLTDPDDEIGHNWVLVVPGQEESVLANGITAGDDRDWLDVNDPGIIAHTRLIEGGESDTITFEAPAAGTYTFLCTFPDHHAGGMWGTLTITSSE